jgi:hypothetical protein
MNMTLVTANKMGIREWQSLSSIFSFPIPDVKVGRRILYVRI